MPFIFSYGSLQQDMVQLDTYGRRLLGTTDALPGYVQAFEEIEDPERAAAHKRTHYANVVLALDPASVVRGTVFDITEEELITTDRYEARDNYTRVEAVLKSGTRAWVYVSARTASRAKAGEA